MTVPPVYLEEKEILLETQDRNERSRRELRGICFDNVTDYSKAETLTMQPFDASA